MALKDMHEQCGQCGFPYARIDTEAWGTNSARRLMCPVCGWTAYEELEWSGPEPVTVKRKEAKGYGAYRLIPPGGYCGYNAFHEPPSINVLTMLKDILSTPGWKGYISIWSDRESRAVLIFGSPLSKFDISAVNSKAGHTGRGSESGVANGSSSVAFDWSHHPLDKTSTEAIGR